MRIYRSTPSLSRDFALLALLIVLGLVFASGWVTYETYRDHSERIHHEMETEAARIDRAMILEIEHSTYLLEALGRQISQMDVHDLRSIALLLRSFDTTATLHHVFSWIDENQNNVVNSGHGVNPKPIDVSDRDFVKKSITDPWKLQIGRPIEGRVSLKWVMPVAIGLTDSTGKYIGTILISMDINTITQHLHAAIHEPGIAFALYSKTLLPLTTESGAPFVIKDYTDKLRMIDFSKHPSGILSTGSIFDPQATFAYYEESADYPYIVVMEFDKALSMNSVRDLLLPRLLQIVLIGLFMLTILWIVRVRVTRPVMELGEVCHNLLRGHFSFPISVSGSSEVMSLARSLEKLAEYLRETRRLEEEKDTKNRMLRDHKDAAELSNRIKTEFLTAMSHELRTPLNTIAGYTEIMQKQLYGPLGNTQYMQCAQDIYAATQQLQSLANDVLTLSRAETQGLEQQEKPVDLRFIINKALRHVTERLGDYPLQVDVQIPENSPRLRMDESRLRDIISNLLLITLAQHTHEGRVILEVKTEKNENGIENLLLVFTDTGSRLTSTRVSRAQGKTSPVFTNLAIPLTKALVALHQASLEIEVVPGKPVVVTVRFPRERIV